MGKAGLLCQNMMGALAEFERALVQERNHAGMRAARARRASRPQARIVAFTD